jgi:hypothetical protein
MHFLMGKCIGKLLTVLPDKQFFKLPGITSDEFYPLLIKQRNTFFISAIYYFIVLKQLWSKASSDSPKYYRLANII